jgi:PQQ-like domain
VVFGNGPRFPVIESKCGWSAAPVVSGDLILLAGGASGQETGEAPILQALDEGGERFRLTRKASGREIEPGEISTTPGGDIVFPVYEHDTSLRVMRVRRDGSVRMADELPDDDPYDVVAYDLGSKLRVAVRALDEEGYLCSWLYRQGRRQGMTYRVWGREHYLWSSEEWLLHASGDTVVGVTAPDYGRPGPAQKWVGRDAATGATRWFLDAGGYVLAGRAGDALIAVDLAAFDRTDRERDHDHDLVLSVARETGIHAIDLATGDVRWTSPVPGRVHSAAVGPDGVAVCAESVDDGTWRVHHLGLDGAYAGVTPLGGHACVVARTADYTLALVEGQWLMALDNPRADSRPGPAEPWTIPIPLGGLAASYAARVADMRLDTVPITLEGTRCHLRGTDSLQIIEV